MSRQTPDHHGIGTGPAGSAQDADRLTSVTKALDRALAEAELLNGIALAASGLAELDQMLATTLDLIRRVVSFTGGSIILLEGDDLIVRAAHGPFAQQALGQRRRRGEGRLGQVVETGEPFLSNDLPAAGLQPTTPLRSYLAVPLRWQGRTFGVLEIDSTEPQSFTAADLDLMQRTATVLSGSIELAQRRAAEAQALAEAEAARDRLQFLTEAGVTLASSALDYRRTLAGIARLAVPRVADWCAVDVVDEGGRIETLITTHQDPAKMTLARQLQSRYPPDPRTPSGPANVIRTGRAEIYPVITDAMLIAAAVNAEHLELLRGLGLASAMVVPLTVEGRTLGAITFVTAESSRRYEETDLALAEELANRAALAVDNARLHEQEQASRLEAERAAGRLARLQEVTAALSRAVTPEQVADVIVDQGIHATGARAGALYRMTEQKDAIELVRDMGYPPDLAGPWHEHALGISTWGTDTVRTREPVFLGSGAALLSRYPQLAALPRPFPDAARAAIPLVTGTRVVGVLILNFGEPRSFTAGDREIILGIAGQCAQAFDRARLYAREHRVAETLQRAFLPAVLPDVPGVRLHAVYLPGAIEADVGGDWYDAFLLPDGCLAVCVGDVAGRGLRAAVVMGQLRQSIRAAALARLDPSEVLAQADAILRLTADTEGLATAVYGVLDPDARTFTYALAGHMPPLLGAPDGSVRALDAHGGPPLGVAAAAPPVRHVSLEPGTLLVLYTDGLVEVAHDLPAGEAALAEAVRYQVTAPSDDPAGAIVASVLRGARHGDDVAVLTIGV